MKRYIVISIIVEITITGKPRFVINWLNERFAKLQIIIFGGSQISVAVPHMFEAIIIGTTNFNGLISSIREIPIATGTIKNIVVTLSRNAESTAVITKNDTNKAPTFHLETSKSLTAIHSNKRV